MTRTLIAIALCLGLAATAAAKKNRPTAPARMRPVALAVYQPRVEQPIVVDAVPPPPLIEAVPEKPRADAIWITGGWKWSGRRFVWTPGLWSAPRPGWIFCPAQWERRSDGKWQWLPAHWQEIAVGART